MNARWKVTLEYTSDDEIVGEEPATTVISQTGYWSGDGHHRPANECVANTMSFVLEMLLASHHGHWSTFEESVDAFSGR